MSPKKDKERFSEVRNSRARRDFFIDETLEAGIVLKGTEVKSIRQGMAQINESFVRIDKGTPILYHAHVAEYAFGTTSNHNPYRPRKLLLNKREIRKWEHAVQSGGRAIIHLRIYFKKGLVKVEIALCRGKKQYDKREDLKKAVDIRETQRTVKHHL
ncbi:MAG: SsrA-binding protein SmpB [Puniceicoccaceae bacterium]